MNSDDPATSSTPPASSGERPTGAATSPAASPPTFGLSPHSDSPHQTEGLSEPPTMIVKVDADGRILDLNAACAAHLGYSIQELKGQPVRWLYHSSDHPTLMAQLRSCLENPNEVHRRQFRKVRKDGTLVWVDEIAFSMRDANGAPYMQVICQDVTDQKRAAEEKEQLFVQLDAIVENVTEGVIISDLHGNVLSMNRAALALHHITRLEDVRRQMVEFGQHFEVADLDGRVLSFDEWPLARALRGECFTDQELRVLHKDLGKSWIWSFNGTPVKTREGESILTVLTVRDITGRKSSEEALRLSEQKLATIFQSIPALVFVSNWETGTIVEINGATLQHLGYLREEVVGRNIQAVGILEDPAELQSVVRMIEERESVRNVELRFRKKNGTAMIGLLSAEAVELNGERSLLILVKDITDRKKMEEEVARLNEALAARARDLEAMNRELEAFSYSVAHDLRRPLNVINGYCQTMQEMCGACMDRECGEYLEETYQATLRMNTLITALLDFSRLSRIEPKRREVDLSALARQLAKELKLTGQGRRVNFVIHEGMAVHADQELMQVVLENLMGNAWKFTGKEEEARIEVGMVQGARKPTYFVRDNGAGFDMADANKLFLPFQRLASPDEFKGSGIGLATVERVIHRHGGKIWAEGAPGVGATFYFTLS